ncbi:hypothetical protein HC011_01570 [Limosilactobacillus fermentum]
MDYQKGYVLMSDLTTLTSSYRTCVQHVYDKASWLLNAANGIFMDADVPKYAVPDLSDELINRNAYIWLKHLMQDVQTAVNSVIACYNYHSLIDQQTGELTSTVLLWIPNSLLLNDELLNNLNNDFKSANETLDLLFDYIEPYL